MIKEDLLRFSAYGEEPGGGISRVFGSVAYHEAAAELLKYFQECGMEGYIDAVDNVHGIYHSPRSAGEQTEVQGPGGRRELLIGSHLDTVKGGGRFDGLLGILTGVWAVKRLRQEQVRLPFDIHLVATNGEEGNDLGGTFGSRCMTGQIDTEDPRYQIKMKEYGYTPAHVENARLDFSNICAYLELHIEQGKTLEEKKKAIGAVTGIVGLKRYQIHIRGEANHAGTTMMEYRKDALVAAAELIAQVDGMAKSYGHQLVATFSKLSVKPNVAAVINSRVDMMLEIRNLSGGRMEEFMGLVQDYIRERPKIQIVPIIEKPPVQCQKRIVDTIEEVCGRLGLAWMEMPSGATHDGNAIAEKTPIGMIFVPSKNGISHSKEEWTEWADCERGAEVLYHTILRLGGAYEDSHD